MNRLDRREASLGIGIALIIVGIGVTGVMHDSALAVIVALTGCVLVLYAFIWDRLESFGPQGVKLSPRQKERAMEILTGKRQSAKAGTATGTGAAHDATVGVEPGPPAGGTDPSEIHSDLVPNNLLLSVEEATTNQEFIDSLLKVIESQNTDAIRKIVREDRERQQRVRRYGPSHPDE